MSTNILFVTIKVLRRKRRGLEGVRVLKRGKRRGKVTKDKVRGILRGGLALKGVRPPFKEDSPSTSILKKI